MEKRFIRFLKRNGVLTLFKENLKEYSETSIEEFLNECNGELYLFISGAFCYPNNEKILWNKLHDKWMKKVIKYKLK